MRASIQAIERRLEHVAGPVPWIGNSAIRTGSWVEIARNHDSSAFYREHPRQVMGLVGIHHDHEISAANSRRRKRTRAMSGEIQTAFVTETDRNLRNGATPADESGGADLGSRERSLKHCLQVRASADVTVADDEYSSRPISSREPAHDGIMTAFVQQAVRQVTSRFISMLENPTCRHPTTQGLRHDAGTRAPRSAFGPPSHSVTPAISWSVTRK